MNRYKAIFSKQTHEGKVLECFGLSKQESGGISLMRWNQTPYNELAMPPQVFDLSAEEWCALKVTLRSGEA